MGVDWATIATVATSVLAVLGVVFWRAIKITWWLGERLDAITQATTNALNEHEKLDQGRQVEILKGMGKVLERIAKVEAKIE